MLEAKGATFYKECKLIEIISDKQQGDSGNQKNSAHSLGQGQDQQKEVAWDPNCNLERIVLKRLDIPDEEEEEEEMDIDEKSQSEHNNDDHNGMNDESNVVD